MDFLGTGNHALLKQGNDAWTNDSFEDDGDVTIDYAEWQDNNLDGTAEKDEPVSYTKGSSPDMTVVLAISPGLTTSVGAKLRVNKGASTLIIKDVSLSGTEITVSGLSWATALPDNVANSTYSFSWAISLDGGATYCDFATTATQFFVVYATPQGSTLTAKRVNWCTQLANMQSTPDEIGDVVGPDAVGGARFGTDSIFGSPPSLSTAWEVMDGKTADCGSLSTLMKYELDLLGATGAEVRFVYARHASWTGLSQPSPPYASYNETDGSGHKLGMWFGGGSGQGWNNYEGCCSFQSKWWEGGNGISKNSAYEVLLHVTSPNIDGATNSHQCWEHDTLTAVPYPPGTP